MRLPVGRQARHPKRSGGGERECFAYEMMVFPFGLIIF